MNRDELLAKCPKLAAFRNDWFELAARVSLLDEPRAGEETGPLRPLQMAVRAQMRLDGVLDEILAMMPPMLDETTAAQLRSFLEKLEGALRFRSDWVSSFEHATHYVVDK